MPKGFSLSVARAEIKGPELAKGRNDMALIYSENISTIAGVFTTNKVIGAPVVMNKKNAQSGKASAIVINSGNSNSCTGKQGMKDVTEMAELTAKHLGINEKHVYVCSTGVIGLPMPMPKVKKGLIALCQGIGKTTVEGTSVDAAARAIMTTDSYPKFLTREVKLGDKTGRITAICKGAGMIEPDMATMLAFIMTDIAIDKSALKSSLKDAVADTFNMLTVDGDQSTSDCVLLMANGALENAPLKQDSAGYKRFSKVVNEICYEMAVMIARDGEGATKLLEVYVDSAKTEPEARKAAKAVANSLLVKTAVYGEDPNWGRMLPVLGRGDITMNPDKVDVYIGKVKIASKGLNVPGSTKKAEKELKGNHVVIRVSLKQGKAKARALSCDLTETYIKINSEYTT
jgi:glutamate N-acetyltransferase/amino-acid N-acetyltransferase